MHCAAILCNFTSFGNRPLDLFISLEIEVGDIVESHELDSIPCIKSDWSEAESSVDRSSDSTPCIESESWALALSVGRTSSVVMPCIKSGLALTVPRTSSSSMI